jgi:ABC-type branched-subunit amino acid transport system permease subunit
VSSAPLAPPDAARLVMSRARWRLSEIVFWIAAFATIFLFPGRHLILTEIAILGLFALSLDLILGYAGIISLGQAAFFGFGGYCAGLLAQRARARDRRGGVRRAWFRDELPRAARLGSHPHHGDAWHRACAARARQSL